jgi:hypothetical protein
MLTAAGRTFYFDPDLSGAMPFRFNVVASTDGVTYSAFGDLLNIPSPVTKNVAFGKCRYVMAGFTQSGNDYKPWIISAPAAPAP